MLAWHRHWVTQLSQQLSLYTTIESLIINFCIGPQFRILASNNFTNIESVRSINIASNPVEIILNGTFEDIARTLIRLYLVRTRLHRIISTWFQNLY